MSLAVLIMDSALCLIGWNSSSLWELESVFQLHLHSSQTTSKRQEIPSLADFAPDTSHKQQNNHSCGFYILPTAVPMSLNYFFLIKWKQIPFMINQNPNRIILKINLIILHLYIANLNDIRKYFKIWGLHPCSLLTSNIIMQLVTNTK